MCDRRYLESAMILGLLLRLLIRLLRLNIGPLRNSFDALELLSVHDLPALRRTRNVPSLVIRIASLLTGTLIRRSIITN